MKTYTLKAVDKFIDHYLNKGGQVINIKEGSLGYGKLMLICDGLKTAIVNEVYLNEWSSGHTVRQYNKIPKTYKKLLESIK